MIEAQTECSACGATGIYKGFAEPAGVGAVCLDCGGSGCKTIAYRPFKQRRHRSDIETVRLSRGKLVALGVGPEGKAINYSEFLRH